LGSGSPSGSQLGSTVTDAPGTVGAYEVPHELTVGSLNHTIDTLSVYWMVITGESGANAVNSQLQLLRAYAVITAT
jgi:hypothetical protein